MRKKFTAFLLIVSLLIACTGCAEKPDVTDATRENSQSTDRSAAYPDGLTGTFTLDSSGQYRNSICRLKQMDEALVLFELDVMQGTEEEDRTSEYVMAGVMLLNEQGTEGVYESDPDALYPLELLFDFDDAGDGFSVTAKGDCGFEPDGHYTFAEDRVEVSEGLAVELIEQLPTAATSLTGNLGGYTVEYPENLISGWFYQVNAVLDDSGATLASFLVSRDLTCVIRADEDIEPVLVWGSMDSTLTAKVLPDGLEPEETIPEEVPEGLVLSESAEERAVVSLEFDNGTFIAVGETSTVVPLFPWEFPYTLELTSSDPAVVYADGNVLTAASEGTAVLHAALTVFDSTVTYEIPLEIIGSDGIPEDLPDDTGTEVPAQTHSDEEAVG